MPVSVFKPDADLQDAVEDILRDAGVDPDTVHTPATPSIWIDGVMHVVGSEWIAVKAGEGCKPRTLDRLAANLGKWLTFLQPRGRTVFGATGQDYRDFENACRRNPDGSDNDATWRNIKSAVKQFHEWLRDEYGVTPPQRLGTYRDPMGQERTRVLDSGRLSSKKRAVYPLTPPQVNAVLRAAKVGDTGEVAVTGRRDVAIFSWMLATGMRLNATAHMTVYEVPPQPERGDHVMVHEPLLVAKNDRAITRPAFAPRLIAVHQYIKGDRDLVRRSAPPYKPARPLLIRSREDGGLATS